MISLLTIITLVSFAYGANYPITDSNNQYGWIQDWSLTDEFWNQNTLNSAKWYDYNPNWLGRQPGLFDPDNVEVKDNKLYMNANIDWNIAQVYKDKGYYTYTTSAVTAKNPLLYGYVEIKAKVGGSRVSSAFWLSNNAKGSTGTWTEIDVFEQAGTVGTSYNDYHVLHSNTHVFALSGTSASGLASKCGCTGTSDCKDPDWWSKDSINSFSDDYHIYGLWWTSSFIKMYVDGELIRTTTNKCFHQELYLKFDRETFPNWFGLPDTSDLPDDPFIIEYVRTWKETGTSSASSYITIENKNGITDLWYAVTISGLPDGVSVTSLQMRDSDMNWWQSGTDKTWYWSWWGYGPYSGPFDFRITLSTGQEITSYDLINNNEVGNSGTMSTAARSAYTEDGTNSNGGLTSAEIVAIGLVVLAVVGCIGLGLYCFIKKRRNMKTEVVKLEKEEVETPVDSNHDGEYDMSPVVDDKNDSDTSKPATDSNGGDTEKNSNLNGDEEIEIDVEVEHQQ